MLSLRWSRALATGALVLASIALVLFVASVFSQGKSFGGMKQHMKYSVSPMMGERGVGWADSWEKEMAQDMVTTDMKMTYPAPAMGMAESMPMPPMMGGSVVSTERKVSTAASLDMRAKSLDWTVGKIREIVKNVGGFVENASTTQPEYGIRSAWMTVKVPADRFDTTLAEVKQTADQVTNENVGSLDMTGQDIDLTARLNNKRAEEKAYENLLSSATKVSDVIEVTRQLTQVRSEIESLEQQARYLEGQTALVTLNLNITEDPKVQGDTGEFKRGNIFKAAVNTLVDALMALGSGLVIFLISGLPILLIMLGAIWLVYRIARRVVNGFFGRM